jgi:hypothetical protein
VRLARLPSGRSLAGCGLASAASTSDPAASRRP